MFVATIILISFLLVLSFNEAVKLATILHDVFSTFTSKIVKEKIKSHWATILRAVASVTEDAERGVVNVRAVL